MVYILYTSSIYLLYVWLVVFTYVIVMLCIYVCVYRNTISWMCIEAHVPYSSMVVFFSVTQGCMCTNLHGTTSTPLSYRSPPGDA